MHHLSVMSNEPGSAKTKSLVKILLIEDNDDDALLFRLAGEKSGGAEIAVMANLEAAIEHLTKDPLPDIVVVDLEIPGMSVMTFLELERTNQKTQRLAVVIYTGAICVSGELAARVSGAFFKSSDLRETVATVGKIVSLARQPRQTANCAPSAEDIRAEW